MILYGMLDGQPPWAELRDPSTALASYSRVMSHAPSPSLTAALRAPVSPPSATYVSGGAWKTGEHRDNMTLMHPPDEEDARGDGDGVPGE